MTIAVDLDILSLQSTVRSCSGLENSTRLLVQVPQAAGLVNIFIFLLKIKFFPIYANNFCDAGQLPIL